MELAGAHSAVPESPDDGRRPGFFLLAGLKSYVILSPLVLLPHQSTRLPHLPRQKADGGQGA